MSEISSGLVAVVEVGSGLSIRWTEPDYGGSCKPYDMLVRLSDAEAIIAQKDAEILEQCRINGMGAEREATLLGKVERQSAALAEQIEKLKDALKTVVDDAEECTDHDDWTAMLLSLDAYHIASTCLEEIDELPDLASPVLNRIRAEENEAIIAAANALENIASTSSSTRIRRVANEALTAIRARRN